MKHEQNIDCGGGYVKLFPSDLDQSEMHGDSPYNIMFGKYDQYVKAWWWQNSMEQGIRHTN